MVSGDLAAAPCASLEPEEIAALLAGPAVKTAPPSDLRESAHDDRPHELEKTGVDRAPLHVTIELGQTSLSRKEVARLARGAVVPLANQAGDPVDIRAAGRLVARGDVVVVDGCFGVRIKELVPGRSERL